MPSPTSRRSVRFCFAFPRCAIGALSLVVVDVGREVRHVQRDRWRHRPGRTGRSSAPRARVEISCNAAAVSTACMASQNLRWSSTFGHDPGEPVRGGGGHQIRRTPLFDPGATSLPSAANARYVPDRRGSPRRARARPPRRSPRPRPTRSAPPRPRRRPRTPDAGSGPASTGARASPAAAPISATEPRYRSETIFGLPSTRPISRR